MAPFMPVYGSVYGSVYGPVYGDPVYGDPVYGLIGLTTTESEGRGVLQCYVNRSKQVQVGQTRVRLLVSLPTLESYLRSTRDCTCT